MSRRLAIQAALVLLVTIAAAFAGCGAGGEATTHARDTTGVPARAANEFVESIGVNTHTLFLDTAYREFDLVEQRLEELGVHHIREDLVTNLPTQYQRLNELAEHGIRATVIMGSPENGIKGLESLIAILKSRLMGAVEAVEGPNEFDLSGGPDWKAKLIPYQRALYAKIKADPVTSSLAVVGPPLSNPNSVVKGIRGAMDYGSVHSYPNAEPPESTLPRALAQARKTSGGKPLLMTETGYHTALAYQGGHRPTSERAEATYMPRLFLDYFANGLVGTFDYELVDERPDPSNTELEMHFGLLHSDFSPKPAFTALKNLISILADPGHSFRPGRLDYDVKGDTSDLHQVLLEKRDGTFYLALWRASSVWDPNAKKPRQAPTVPVTLEFKQPLGSIREYRPNDSSEPVGTLHADGGSLSVGVGPRVTILALQPS